MKDQSPNLQLTHTATVYRISKLSLSLGSSKNPSALRLRTEVHSHHDSAHPLRITVESDHNILHWWRLPIAEGNTSYNVVERTIVVEGNDTDPEQKIISVILTTLSKRDVSFTIELYEVKDFILPHDDKEGVVGSVSPHAPKLYYIDLQDCNCSRTIHVNSKDDVCAIVSLQRADQPLIYTDDVMRHEGPRFQSMLKQGGNSIDI